MPIRTILVAAIASLSFAATAQAQFWSPSSTELTATNGASDDYFGYSVALDGDTCVIGAEGTNSNTGSAYVFTNTGGTWSQVADLTATNGAGGDRFGASVALDGSTCVVGAWGTNGGTGSAYVFTNTNGTWSQVAELTATNEAVSVVFGHSVALDGSTCVVGDPGANGGTGSAYVFTNTNGTWSQVAELTATNEAVANLFGWSVALDGSTCVIGAYGVNSGTGRAYVFTNTNGTWSLVAELTATGGASLDLFGTSVSLDGSTCVIGARGTNSFTGSAYVFTNTNGTWSQVAELTAANGAGGDNFGNSVSLDGSTCVIGAFTGSAYVFTNTNGTWSQVAELTAPNEAVANLFGWSVALDGSTCVIGAYGTNSLTGSAYVYGSGRAATGACCLGGTCVTTTQSDCTAAGGTYAGDEVACANANCATTTPGDVDGDGDVDTNDLSSLRSTLALCASDVDSDGDTDIEDLLSVISGYGGTTCP